MYKILFITSLLLFSTICLSGAIPPKGYHLVWSDEFNGSQVDTTAWTFQTGDNGWGNNELQYYTRGQNVALKNGMLSLIVRKEAARYTSTRMITQHKRTFTYGWVEIRAKLPQGAGTWPALWMLGNNIDRAGFPQCGELDIMEHVGKNPGFIHCAVHNPSETDRNPYVGIRQINDPFHTFHLYAMEWTKEQIRFLIDGKEVYRYRPAEKTAANWPFDKPMFFIFNIAIGGSWSGPVTDPSIFPQQMDIDYIRVYQKNRQ